MDELLKEIKELIEHGQRDDKEWKQELLDRFDIVNGTVRVHTTGIALLDQTVKRQDRDMERQGTDLEAVCGKVRELELSNAKSAGIGGIAGAVIGVVITAAMRVVAK